MEGRLGGCCIVRYVGGYVLVYDMLKMDRIMFRFCFIVFKLVVNGEVFIVNGGIDGYGKVVVGGRGWRKFVKESSSSSWRCINGKKRKFSLLD